MELIVSDFMTNTCRVRPRPIINRFNALCHVSTVTNQPVNDGDYKHIVTSSGSASEFYIEPLLSCINDIDIMSHRNDWLAIPEGHPVPRCLPAEFHREVLVYELVETEYPCYVLARSVCKRIKCTNSDNYTRVSTEPDEYATTTIGEKHRHGPAALNEAMSLAPRCFNTDESGSSYHSLDAVFCIRCLVWPPQATEWTTRRREYNWPDTATINWVVNNGCDVVQVAHPRCREDEWMNRRQWRLSFSRAETVLLNTWLPKQQLIYHMLRVFITSIKNDIGESVIKRYYIKTVMLWTCERYSKMWQSSCVVNICTQLLHELANRLLSAQFPMYFVTQCNLNHVIEYSNVFESNVAKLLNVTNEYISIWFADNYIRQFASQYPHIASSLNDIRTLTDLHRVLTTVSNVRQYSLIECSFDDFENIQSIIQQLLNSYSVGLSLNALLSLIEQMNTIDSRFFDFIGALYFLKAVSLLDNGHDTRLVVRRVIASLQSFNKFRLSTHLQSANSTAEFSWSAFSTDDNDVANETLAGCRYFQGAHYLMQTVRCSRNNKLTSLLKELTKLFLQNSLKHVCDGDSHTGAVRVYMACLYYSTGQYRTALEYCVTAITSVQSGNNVNCIERQLLPQFDDNIERVLGIILLYQFVHKSSLNQVQQSECNDVYSVDLLAHYLVALCLKQQHIHSKCCTQNEFYFQYRKRLYRSGNIFIADILLFYFHQVGLKQTRKLHIYSLSHKCPAILTVRGRSTQFNANRLSRLLIQSSVEYLSSFRRVMSRDYNSVRTIVTRDYEAMFAYKCGLYEQCFELSDENVNFLLYTDGNRITYVLCVDRSDLLMLMDDVYLSLISLSRLCGVIVPRRTPQVNQLTLSMYLLVQSKLRLRHSVTSLIDILRVIQRVHDRHSERAIIDRATMASIYRKTVIHLKQRPRQMF